MYGHSLIRFDKNNFSTGEAAYWQDKFASDENQRLKEKAVLGCLGT
jgi:hypothetical protein